MRRGGHNWKGMRQNDDEENRVAKLWGFAASPLGKSCFWGPITVRFLELETSADRLARDLLVVLCLCYFAQLWMAWIQKMLKIWQLEEGYLFFIYPNLCFLNLIYHILAHTILQLRIDTHHVPKPLMVWLIRKVVGDSVSIRTHLQKKSTQIITNLHVYLNLRDLAE